MLLTGCAFVRFNKLGKGDLANQLDIFEWNFKGASDSNCGTMMKSNSKLMRDNIDDLDPDYVTDGDLDAVDLLIQKFIDLQGTSEAVHSASPEITAEFTNSFAPVKDEMENVLLVVRKNFKMSTPKFITELEAAAKKPTVNVHHTIISIHATKKSNDEPVEGILFSETKSGKSGKTDFKGNAEIDKVKSGDDVLTGVLAGITVYSGHINNKRGKNNHYNIVIESM